MDRLPNQMRYLATISFLLLSAAPFCQTKAATGPGGPPVVAKFLDLFDQLREAQDPAGEHKHVAFQLSETEINDYLRSSLKTAPPRGADSIPAKLFPKY